MPRGSAPGERRGGRQKGSRNQKTAEQFEQAAAAGLTPLDYMLDLLRRDDTAPALRFEAAKAAAPYIHPKLANVEIGNKDGKPFQLISASTDKSLI